MEFKIGDKVKLKRGNYNHVGEIIDILECDIIGSNKIDDNLNSRANFLKGEKRIRWSNGNEEWVEDQLLMLAYNG